MSGPSGGPLPSEPRVTTKRMLRRSFADFGPAGIWLVSPRRNDMCLRSGLRGLVALSIWSRQASAVAGKIPLSSRRVANGSPSSFFASSAVIGRGVVSSPTMNR
jgi:hypothetical protein